MIAIALGQPTLDFGGLVAGATATPVSESVTVTSNDTAGYTLTAHRSAFTPRDLPLGLSATAPSGGTLGDRHLVDGPRGAADRAGGRPDDRLDVGGRAGERRHLGDEDRLHGAAAERARPVSTPRPSRTR